VATKKPKVEELADEGDHVDNTLPGDLPDDEVQPASTEIAAGCHTAGQVCPSVVGTSQDPNRE